MSQFGVGMVFAWWRFGVDGGICLGLAMGFVVVGECWREGMLGKRNVGVVECRYSQTGIAVCSGALFPDGNSGLRRSVIPVRE